MRVFIRTFLVVLVGLSGLRCSRSTESNGSVPTPNPTPINLTAAEKSLLESSNRFGLKLFREVASREEPDSNIFISPLSVSYALGVTYNGAAGETREAMASTLEMSGLSVEEINESYRHLIDLLTQLDSTVVMDIANSIWYRLGLPVSPAFIDLNLTYFDALVRELNFDAPWAADTINNWVDVNTNGKIKKIVESPIDPYLVMFLINAIYFKGAWTIPFDTSSTLEFPFTLAGGTHEPRQFMRTDTTFSYADNDLFQAIDLPYGDKQFSMTVFLPKPSLTVDSLIARLTDENWAAWLGEFSEQTIELWLPKFKFKYDVKLNDMLKAMGMEIAFSPVEADFGNMVSGPIPGNLFIDYVMHKTFVQVDEEGTEAAAVTVVGIGITGIEPNPRMIVNRPFLFVIREHESGTILFMGRVADPVWND